MREHWRYMKEYLDSSLRRQLVFYLMFCVLLPLTLVTSLLFVKARQEMKRQAVLNVRQRAEIIAGSVDELIYNIQGVSDQFAYTVEMEARAGKKYGDRLMEKQRDINELNSYFKKTDLLYENERIGAIYTRYDEVLNFTDPYMDETGVKEKMLQMGAKDKSALSMFRWFPLEDNFLKAAKTGEIRRDHVVVGMRRILHPFTGVHLYTQFFAIEEAKLSDLYMRSVEEVEGQVFITDDAGSLISATDEEAVASMAMPSGILTTAGKDQAEGGSQISYRGESYITSSVRLSNVDWQVITMVPVRVVTAPVDRLFHEIIVVMAVCIVAGVFVVSWISHRFLKPVEVLDASMKEVYNGNMEAYVKPDEYHGELRNMMGYYNSMLVQINHFIRQQVENAKKKKELELEVLMGQINPHFLYNTLENIVWKSNEAGRPDIGRMAASMGRLYRLSIGNGETVVPIQQEIEHVMAYVNIQKNRYKDRMEFDLSVSYEEVWGFSMIKLTLQPVVENCFMYAMEDIDHVLKVRLSVRVGEELIRFYVLDNGRGIPKEQLAKVREQIEYGKVNLEEEQTRKKRKGTGIGLYSVKERISIYTGYQEGVKIQSKAGMGTLVTVTIPKIRVKDDEEEGKGEEG